MRYRPDIIYCNRHLTAMISSTHDGMHDDSIWRYDSSGESAVTVNHVEGVISLGAGLGAIGIGFVGKTFYAVGPGQRPTEHTKTVPRWFGRLWFVACGSFFVYFSFPSALGRWTRADFQEAGWIAVFLGAVFLLNQILKRFRLGRGLFRDNTFQRLLPKD